LDITLITKEDYDIFQRLETVEVFFFHVFLGKNQYLSITEIQTRFRM